MSIRHDQHHEQQGERATQGDQRLYLIQRSSSKPNVPPHKTKTYAASAFWWDKLVPCGPWFSSVIQLTHWTIAIWLGWPPPWTDCRWDIPLIAVPKSLMSQSRSTGWESRQHCKRVRLQIEWSRTKGFSIQTPSYIWWLGRPRWEHSRSRQSRDSPRKWCPCVRHQDTCILSNQEAHHCWLCV